MHYAHTRMGPRIRIMLTFVWILITLVWILITFVWILSTHAMPTVYCCTHRDKATARETMSCRANMQDMMPTCRTSIIYRDACSNRAQVWRHGGRKETCLGFVARTEDDGVGGHWLRLRRGGWCGDTETICMHTSL